MQNVVGESGDPAVAAVQGTSTEGNAVVGISHVAGRSAVVGTNDNTSDQAGAGVWGESRAVGVVGKSSTWHGVYGETQSTTGGQGVHGTGHVGVAGVGQSWVGVYGETLGSSNGVAAVWADGKDGGFGVKGHARAAGAAGVAGYHLANAGPGIYGEGAPAGFFRGDVVVTGDLVLEGADYAESLTVADVEVEPGMVVVLDDEGRVRPCTEAYDARVAGIVSGAGSVKPALVLDRHEGGAPVALMGKLWALADATEHPIRPGDLLTTSATPGHAQRVVERDRATGAMIGKALTALPGGVGLVRVLVCAS